MPKGFWSVYTSWFEDMASEHNDFEGEYLADPVKIVLTGPNYNTCREHNRDNSAHEILRGDGMNKLPEIVQQFLSRGGHNVIFCSSNQFRR